MENNILLEEVQVNGVIEDGIEIVDDVVEIQEGSDLTKTVVMIGVGALLVATPIVYKKVLKPGFNKLIAKFGKKELCDTEVIDVDSESVENIEQV